MGNKEIFDEMAHKYDTPERVRFTKGVAKTIRELLRETETKKGIDFGCGTGLIGLNLVDAFESVLFLDMSQNMVDQVDEKIAELGIENAETLCFDFESDHLEDKKADYIFMSQVLLHIEDYKSVLKKLYEVLNPGGHLIIVDFDKNEEVVTDMIHNGFIQEELAEEISEIGFSEIHAQALPKQDRLMGEEATMFVMDGRK